MDDQVTVQKLIDQGFSKRRAESMSELSNELTKEGFKCVSEGIPVLNGGQLLVSKPAGIGIVEKDGEFACVHLYDLIASVILHDKSYGREMCPFEVALYNNEGDTEDPLGFLTKEEVVKIMRTRSYEILLEEE